MIFELTDRKIEEVSASQLVVFVFEDKNSFLSTNSFKKLDAKLSGLLSKTLEEERFEAKEGSQITVYTQETITSPKIVIFGLGKKNEFNRHVLRRIAAKIAKSKGKSVSSIVLSLFDNKEIIFSQKEQLYEISLGLLLGSYQFIKYKKKDEKIQDLETVLITTPKNTKTEEAIRDAKNAYLAIKLARDLVNEHASFVTPAHLGKIAAEIAKKDSLIKCRVYNKTEIEKMGMQAFLGVARGSDTPPVFIHLEYSPKGYKGKEKLAIVGKGITFDTGGVSLKPSQYMTTMKCDMAGSAAVLGLFSIISSIKPKVAVIGLIAATPNLVSGKSIVPGDVVRAMNGKTIEVLNTDAEGRVTMADSLSYAVKNGATKIIDLATLTGACMAGLGTDYAGLFSNNKEFKKKLLASAEEAGEKVWEMPLVKEYKELNKSDVADVANISSSSYGGAITAALFLEEFVDEKPWVHLDIAGPAFAEKEHPLGSKGGTGFGVETLINLLKP